QSQDEAHDAAAARRQGPHDLGQGGGRVRDAPRVGGAGQGHGLQRRHFRDGHGQGGPAARPHAGGDGAGAQGGGQGPRQGHQAGAAAAGDGQQGQQPDGQARRRARGTGEGDRGGGPGGAGGVGGVPDHGRAGEGAGV